MLPDEGVVRHSTNLDRELLSVSVGCMPCFCVGDRIVEVNGCRGDAKHLVAECRRCPSLTLVVTWPAEHIVHPNICVLFLKACLHAAVGRP